MMNWWRPLSHLDEKKLDMDDEMLLKKLKASKMDHAKAKAV